jgi:hypothetical protein
MGRARQQGALRVPLARPVQPGARPRDRAGLPRRGAPRGRGQRGALLLHVRPQVLLDEDHAGRATTPRSWRRRKPGWRRRAPSSARRARRCICRWWMRRWSRAIDLAHDRCLVLAQATPTASSEDVEQGPASAPTLLMAQLAMFEGASRRGRTERCLRENLDTHLHRGFHDGTRVFLSRMRLPLRTCSARSVQEIGMTRRARPLRKARAGIVKRLTAGE